MVSQEEATPVVFNIPKLPTGTVKDFVSYVSKNPKTPIARLLEPYKAFESELRKVYAQQPSHEAVKDGGINLVPIFAGHEGEIRIRARRLDAETEEEKGKYIMSLKDEDRKPEGAPAVVSSFKDFQQNFNLFSESSLTELNWNNVVAAGTAVTTALLPVPHQWAGNKRTLRTYYHEHLAPASDVDLFLYGLNEEQAIEKIKQIERSIKDSILHETITVRTKNAITIASQHPTRHVQIVLRLYDSLSQIVTGFDVDCACAVYDGKQVYAAPRAVVAFMTQCNTIDLGRRSPSYESRLSKYSRRGFEIYWPLLDRSLIDPTIFERSFGRIQGLARLLVLEKLPTVAARDSYTDQRRRERGRPARRREVRNQRKLVGNIKDQEEEEIAEWAEEDDVSSYHTLTIPYGPKFHASRINRLLYAKDLLLNAEWNQNEERKVYLHRHPCFIGTAEEVIQDCCGFCPVPRTDEEIEIADEEKKRYISGKLTFLTDNPGRQEIGSFHPINDDEWATTAYVGDTARLCQAIVDGDLEYVRKWCAQKGVDVNRRDYTGRTPLHLAAMSSSPEIVRCLINAGARLVARLVDGQTALHIAATRGSAEIVKALMNKSLANEEEEYEKDGRRRAARRKERQAESAQKTVSPAIEGEDMSGSEASVGEGNMEKECSDSMTMGSFVKIDKPNPGDEDDVLLGDATNDPDIYDINVVAWDYGLTPLHFAILNGHLNLIELLISEYGADVLLPVKLDPLGSGNSKTIIPKGAIMTITLAAMCQPTDSAIEVARLLLKLGATSAQSDMDRFTVLHTLAAMDAGDILDSLFEYDRPAALSVLNSVGYCGKEQAVETPLSAAINRRHGDIALRLLKHGAKPMIAFEDWVKYYLSTEPNGKNMSTEQVQLRFMSSVMQPLVAATIQEMGGTINGLIAHGADPCTLGTDAQILVQKSTQPTHNFFRPVVTEAVLDIVRNNLKKLRQYDCDDDKYWLRMQQPPEVLYDEKTYLHGLVPGSYQFWTASHDYQNANRPSVIPLPGTHEFKHNEGVKLKLKAAKDGIQELESIEKVLTDAGAKTFNEQHPNLLKVEINNSFTRTDPYRLVRKPYSTVFDFSLPDLDDTKKARYIKLFEAAWSNDVETVKNMTLGSSPLQIAVKDKNGFYPFSLAVLRGHYGLARTIGQICRAQYHSPSEKNHRRIWTMLPTDSDEEEPEDGPHGLPIISHLVSDEFTINNLAEVSATVKSDVLPVTMIEWPCMAKRFNDSDKGDTTSISLLQYAVDSDNMALARFILQLERELVVLAVNQDGNLTRDIKVAFYDAVRRGRTSILAEMIRITGAGIPFDNLAKRSGLEIKEKPKYYQGLTVGGKKRADWAKRPGDHDESVNVWGSPLLVAANNGCLDSVKWFMSAAAMRAYKEFAVANKRNKTIEALEKPQKGLETTIGNWLNGQSELILHIAVMYKPWKGPDYDKHIALVEHLVSIFPNSLEQKSSDGYTPLHIAVLLGYESLVSYFISIGADQRKRDKIGRNLVHMLVTTSKGQIKKKASELESIIELFDKDLVKDMMVERCTWNGETSTPLALWMSSNKSEYTETDFVQILAKYSTGEDLEMINGEGDLPLHMAIKHNLSSISAFFLSLNPALLHRENATGRTPFEMARDMYFASCVKNPPAAPEGVSIGPRFYRNVLKYPAISFVPEGRSTPIGNLDRYRALDGAAELEPQPEESAKRTYLICMQVDEELKAAGIEGERKRKRRLASLFEANQVAKRVAERNRDREKQRASMNKEPDNQKKGDVVSDWLVD